MRFILNKNKKTKETVEVKQKPQITIEQIHKSFYEEVDRILEEANIDIVISEDKNLSNKANSLVELGFGNTKTVKEYNIQKQDNLIKANKKEENKEIIEAVKYFSNKYPFYKFITEESVKKLCKKYGFIYGQVTSFIGDVPDKNLKDIQNFKIDDIDKAFLNEKSTSFGLGVDINRWYTNSEAVSGKNYTDWKNNYSIRYSNLGSILEIVAPLSDFDTTNMVISNYQLKPIVDEDPIVLQPVMYKDTKHYLIVTAWGPEASDPEVVNEILN